MAVINPPTLNLYPTPMQNPSVHQQENPSTLNLNTMPIRFLNFGEQYPLTLEEKTSLTFEEENPSTISKRKILQTLSKKKTLLISKSITLQSS